MSIKIEDVRPYIDNEIPLRILLSVASKEMPLSKVVKSAGGERADVVAWIHEMKSKGLIEVHLEPPNSESEARISLAADAKKAIQELRKPFPE